MHRKWKNPLMATVDSFYMMIMECHLLQCIGNTALIIWSADTMTFTEYRCQILHLMYADTPIARIWHKTLQYLMGHSDISVIMNVYTHIGFDDAEEELKRMEEFKKAQAEVEKKNDAKAVSQKMFKVI